MIRTRHTPTLVVAAVLTALALTLGLGTPATAQTISSPVAGVSTPVVDGHPSPAHVHAAAQVSTPPDVGGGMGTQVVGGHPASQVYEGIASLQYDAPAYGRVGWTTCTASMIERGWVVLAAHCATNIPALAPAATGSMFGTLDERAAPIPTENKQFSVRVGSHDRTRGVVLPVRRFVVHPGWDWASGDGPAEDVLLAQVEQQEFAPFEIAAKVPAVGEKARLLGFGLTTPDASGSLPRFVQELDSTVVAAKRCRDSAITALDLCVNNPHGTAGVCNGDSGGPLLTKIAGTRRWAVVGVSSRTAGDCGQYPAVYTSIADPQHRRWIYDVMAGRLDTTLPLTQAQGGAITSPYAPITTTGPLPKPVRRADVGLAG
ncbi:S1 family peptidase [Actinokineospora cianjurensis]|uniref:Trypsin n=1 Tax=Actinokineospora cianjurensis TaxID=585224 RepID=A0A421B223_9PSEU|nr:trypsin-like serine protease [Actinokineospora cianjurensis]RLK58407.1 trypsin [Actinokineospora cianjurensis]